MQKCVFHRPAKFGQLSTKCSACSDVTKSVISKKNPSDFQKTQTMSNCCIRRPAKFHIDNALRFWAIANIREGGGGVKRPRPVKRRLISLGWKINSLQAFQQLAIIYYLHDSSRVFLHIDHISTIGGVRRISANPLCFCLPNRCGRDSCMMPFFNQHAGSIIN